MSKQETLQDLNRQCQNLYSKSWRLRNPEHVKKMNLMRSERNNLLKAIPKIKAKLEGYQKRVPELEKEMKQTSRYRILGKQRKRKSDSVENKS